MMFRSGTDRLENRTVARPREVRSAASRDRPSGVAELLRLVVESLEDRTVLTTLLSGQLPAGRRRRRHRSAP